MNALKVVDSYPSIESYEDLKDKSERPFDNMMFLGDVLSVLKISRAHLYKEIAAGKAPKPVGKYQKKSVWRRDEVQKCWDDRVRAFK